MFANSAVWRQNVIVRFFCGAVVDADFRSPDADSLLMEFYDICTFLMQTPLNY